MSEIFEQIPKKPLIILGQGPSLAALEENIQQFKDLDVIWCGLNKYDTAEDQILSAINCRFSVLWCSALKRFKQMKMRLKKSSSEGSLIMSKTAIINMMNFSGIKYQCDFGTGFSSIFAMLCALVNLRAKRIYLIGFDGRAESKDNVYYKQETVSDDFEGRMRSILRDTMMMNKVFWDYVEYSLNVPRDKVKIKILPGSALSCFEDRISVTDMASEIRRSQRC